MVEAESQIPLAMAEAFRSGNLGIMDYYRMRNIEADTEMRESISSEKISNNHSCVEMPDLPIDTLFIVATSRFFHWEAHGRKSKKTKRSTN